MSKKHLLYSVAALLVFAIGLQIYPYLVRAEVTKTESLDDLVSAELPGWIMEELELGQTEEVRNAVERRLRFDDVISRIYRQGRAQQLLEPQCIGNGILQRDVAVNNGDGRQSQ